VNSRDRDLITPLLWAAYHNHINAVKYLVSAKAGINDRGKDGITALMRAVENRNVDMVKFLLSARADVNIVDNYKGTALSRAVNEIKDASIADILKKAGAG
jgi:ankyrin repeat protein